MPYVALLSLLVLGGLGAYLFITRYRNRQRLAARASARPSVTAPVAPAPSLDAVSPAAPPVDTIAQVFPVFGLAGDREAAAALQATVRSWDGVVSAYVSPVTAYAYLDYRPAQVTEEQLVQALQGTGYRVGDSSRRFHWRNAAQRS